MLNLYVNLSRDDGGEQLRILGEKLRLIQSEKMWLEPENPPYNLKLADEQQYRKKLEDMLGKNAGYKINQVAPNYLSGDSVIAADQLAHDLAEQGVRWSIRNKTRWVSIPGKDTIFYDNTGIIVHTLDLTTTGQKQKDAQQLMGKDALQYLACNLAQDLALVVKRGDDLQYALDISMYEKTPKDPVTGENRYVGRGLLEFHGKAKTYGKILPEIQGDLRSCMGQELLDTLTIDLRGGNTYTDGKTIVRRFERDYLVALRRWNPHWEANVLVGLLGYADVHFQDVNERLSPYEGGETLPKEDFHERYRVIK